MGEIKRKELVEQIKTNKKLDVNNVSELFFNKRAYIGVLGTLLNKPWRLKDPKYTLTEDDFYNDLFYKIIFDFISNNTDKESLTTKDLERYLIKYPTIKEELERKKIYEWIDCAKDLADCIEKPFDFDYWYNIIKKDSIILYFSKLGFGYPKYIEYYNNEKTTPKQLLQLYYDYIIRNAENKFNIRIKTNE